MAGTMGARTVVIHSVIASSESLMPRVGPWLKISAVRSAPFTLVANPVPTCTARELLLKSLGEPRMALQ